MAFDGRESVQLLGVSQVPYSGPGLCQTAPFRPFLNKIGQNSAAELSDLSGRCFFKSIFYFYKVSVKRFFT
jgi:hypothetical protein